MAEYYKGTLVASPIVRGFSGDTYGTHHSVLGVGGYMEVPTLTARNQLQPTGSTQITNLGLSLNYDGMSIGQRRLGMLVYVQEEGTVYQLQVPESTWSGYTATQKQNALINNNNWITFFSGTEIAERISKTINQTTHGFVAGDAIGYDGSSFLKIASTGATSNRVVLGLVTEVPTANSFEITYSGYINTTGMLDYSGGTLSAGTAYYVSTTAGKLTSQVPIGLNILSRPILLKTSGNTGVVLQYRGTKQSDAGVDVGTFTGYTASTQAFLDTVVTGATNIGYFSGKTGIQRLNLSGTFTCTGYFNSAYNYYYRDSGGVIRIGSPTHNGDCRRAYVHDNGNYSWVYNTYTGASNCVGWIQVASNVTSQVGTFVAGVTYDYSGGPYTAVTWTGFTSRGTTSVMPYGSLLTGSTYETGGPIYRDKRYQELRLRTICSLTPNSIGVQYDDNFIKLSGVSNTQGIFFASNGLCKRGQYVTLGGTLTGNTYIYTCTNQLNIQNQLGTPISCFYLSPTYINGIVVDTYVAPTYQTCLTLNYTGGALVNCYGGVTRGFYAGFNSVEILGNCVCVPPSVIGCPSTTGNGCCLTFKGSDGFTGAGGGHGGNVWLCGGTAGGAVSCTGGTVYIQGGTGAGGSNGLIKMFNLPARTTETKHLYISTGGTISCGEISQQPVVICQAAGGNYNAQNRDYFIGVCSGMTVVLPSSPATGEIKVVADVGGGADASNNIYVDGGTKNIIGYGAACIDTDYGSITFLYNGTEWSVIAFTAAPSYGA